MSIADYYNVLAKEDADVFERHQMLFNFWLLRSEDLILGYTLFSGWRTLCVTHGLEMLKLTGIYSPIY